MEKKWRTGITLHKGEDTYIRGYKLLDLVGNLSFSQAIYLILKGELPSEKEAKMMDAIFVSVIDHGIAPPSVIAARAVASGGNTLNVGVAAGVATFGSAHGGALEDAMKFMQDNIDKNIEKLVKEYLENKKPIPGFGHKYYKEFDPRTKRLMDIAKSLGFYDRYCAFAEKVEEEIFKQKGKKLVLNVDGAIAAVTSEMGFDWRLGKGFFIIGRVPGLVAHVYEELTKEKPFSKRLNEEEETEYTGIEPRELPQEFKKVLMILRVKVKPNAKTVSVEQLEDKSLKISIKSPPVNGKANEELIKVLSEFLKVSKSKINIKAGKSSREKLVEIYD